MDISIAVIIPVYNASAYLDYVFKSLHDQTVPADEIICVDDGSTDDSAGIITRTAQAYPELNIKLLHQKNSGTASACNAGVNICSSDYVIILGSDDILLPRRIEEDKKDLSRHRADMIFGPTYTFADHPDDLRFLRKKHLQNLNYIDHDPVKNGVLKRLHIPTNAATVKKSVWDRLGGYDTSISYSEDYDFWIRFFCTQPDIRYRHTPLSAYRFSATHQSKSKHFDRKILSRIRIVEKFFNDPACSRYHYLKPRALVLMYETLAHDYWAAGDVAAFKKYAVQALRQGIFRVQLKTIRRLIKSVFKR